MLLLKILISKEYKDWDGYIVIEEVGDNKFHYSVWVENKKYVVDGYDSEMVEQLKINKGITKYNNESFSSNVKETFTGTSGDKGGTGWFFFKKICSCMYR